MEAKTFSITNNATGQRKFFKSSSEKDLRKEYNIPDGYTVEEVIKKTKIKPEPEPELEPEPEPEANEIPFSERKKILASQMADAIFPSIRAKTPEKAIREGIEGNKDVARLSAEAITYPLRAAGGVLNLIARNKRRGDYGVGETYEESGQGYNEYDFPFIGKASPMAMTQEILHDPLNAVGGGFEMGLNVARNIGTAALTHANRMALKRAMIGATQEAARPAITDAEFSPENAFAAGLSNASFGIFSDEVPKLAAKVIKEKIVPNMIKNAAINNKISKKSIEAVTTPEGIRNIEKAWETQGDLIHDATAPFDPQRAGKFFKEDSKLKKAGLEEVESPIDAAIKENERLSMLKGQRLAELGVDELTDQKLAEYQKINNVANTILQPRKHTAAELDAIRKELQDEVRKSYANTAGADQLFEKEIKESAHNVRKAIIEELQKKGTPGTLDAIEAMKRIAARKEAQELAKKHLLLGNDYDKLPKNMEKALQNMHRSDAATKYKNESLRKLDDAFNLDILSRAQALSMAKELVPFEHLPDQPFEIGGANKWQTGRSPASKTGVPFLASIKDNLAGNTPSGAVRNIKAVKNIGDILSKDKILPEIAVYERQITPQQQEMHDFIYDMYGEKAAQDYRDSLGAIDYSNR
jgi:hypothetical protein